MRVIPATLVQCKHLKIGNGRSCGMDASRTTINGEGSDAKAGMSFRDAVTILGSCCRFGVNGSRLFSDLLNQFHINNSTRYCYYH